MLQNSLSIIKKGVYSKKKPSTNINNDISYGAFISYAIGRDDAGQCVVVKNRTIMAVQAYEERKDTIQRGCSLSHNKACIIIMNKLSNSDSDKVVINNDILLSLKEYKAQALALEENVYIENIDEFIKNANKLKLVVMSFNKDEIMDFVSKGK